jgi:hypothetical protein
MDDEDLALFLRDLHGSMLGAAERARLTGQSQARLALETLERICATYRPLAEAQHGHNTAPGPDTADRLDVVEGCPGAAIDHDETGVCNHD